MTMDELKPGQSAYISSVGGSGALRHHLLDMGLTPQTEITLQKVAPMGDPVQFQLRGYELTLRLEEARKVTVNQVHTKPVRASVVGARRNSSTPHPGVGELVKAGGYHTVHDGAAIPKGSPLTFALAGNQNCGKTTLFNQLTGSNQHVGNFPGVTVDRKDGTIRSHPEATVTDLPGIYSLSPYSNEEIVTRDFLLNTHPSGIINIVDASNIERNLYLTMQLMELGIPMVLALNMMDEVRANGGSILVNELEQILGIPVVPVSAAKNEGIDELIDHAIHVARYREVPVRVDFCPESRDSTDKVGAVHRCIHAASMLLAPDIQAAGLPVRFSTTKLVENDELIGQKVNIPDEKKHAFDHLVNIMEQETGMDREAALANMRFTFLQHLCEKTVVRPRESREHRRSIQIDRLLTGKYTAIPCFIGIMAIVFLMTFSLIGAWLSDLMSMGVDFVIDWIAKGLEYLEVNPVVQSLVVDGVCAGVGSVLSFLPTIVTLFFFLSILEDTGYMARVAFVMDRPLRKLGLSGRSFVPMLVGFGCSVPAIMATRTLSSERDRKMTILLTPFMSCSAKIPIYAVFTAAFFPQHAVLTMALLYFGGMVVGVLISLLLNHTVFRGNPVPFVMELPNYRLPTLKSVAMLLWDKARDFLQRAFTVIFVATLAIWFLESFDLHLNFVTDSSRSLLASIGRILAPVFRPLGFEDWRVTTALITGFTAKEAVVSTLGILTGAGTEHLSAALSGLFTPLSAVSFLTFTLLYTPCVAAIAAIGRELGGKLRGAVVAVFQCVVAWCVAAGLYQLLLLIA